MSPCTKNGYKSEAFARKIAKRRMRDDHTIELRVYRCQTCGLWHLTHQPNKFRRDRDDEK